jgi:HEPN domain-containing protein
MVESLEYPEDLIKKSRSLVSSAEEELKRYGSYSNVILWCQTAIELSGKAIFKIMGLDFPKEHQLMLEKRNDMRPEVKELLRKEFPKFFDKDKVPRILFLTYFWSEFYTIAKYGIDGIPPDKLFTREDAELALKHAKDCVNITGDLFFRKKSEEAK